ncbi:MAG: hypothetical protein ABJH98_19775 [Reichenbachiella sp.]|uniref:hypothetical protein n=1 Tax=Reichenbachiella sp. TaxID=2184521 RepID=UPI00329A4C08
MDGFTLIDWYRNNRNILDSIPRGFQIHNDSLFSIKMLNNYENLPKLLQNEHFSLFKLNNKSFVGSGPFELVNLNEDISAQLIRRDGRSQLIQSIELSFMKNSDLAYSEFFRGSLDLVFYSPHKLEKTKHSSQLDKIYNTKYAPYQICRTNESRIKYMRIDIQDTTFTMKILSEIKMDNKYIYSNSIQNYLYSDELDSLTSLAIDSSDFEISWRSDISNETKDYFKNTPDFKFVKSKNSNPTEPQIVIKEEFVEFVYSNEEKSLEKIMQDKLKMHSQSTFLLLDVDYSYVIFSNRLKGIERGHSLSKMVQHAYFENAKTY